MGQKHCPTITVNRGQPHSKTLCFVDTMSIDQAALYVFTAIVIGAISAWITAQLALRRFRAEKWWERKAEAYSRVIEALHNSKVWTEEHLKANFDNGEIPEAKRKELGNRARAAYDELRKAMDVGAFLLCDEALSRLKQYEKETRELERNPPYQYLKADFAATENCLNELIEIAKRDLKTK